LKHVDAAYPFGEREMYPYRGWLKARRRLCAEILPTGLRAKADCLNDLDWADAVVGLSPRTAMTWLLDLAADRPDLAAHPIMDRAQELAAEPSVSPEEARLVLAVVRAEVAPLWAPKANPGRRARDAKEAR
jgi:hypothetical protein